MALSLIRIEKDATSQYVKGSYSVFLKGKLKAGVPVEQADRYIGSISQSDGYSFYTYKPEIYDERRLILTPALLDEISALLKQMRETSIEAIEMRNKVPSGVIQEGYKLVGSIVKESPGNNYLTDAQAVKKYGKDKLKAMKETGWLDGVTGIVLNNGETALPISDYERALAALEDPSSLEGEFD